MKLSTEAGIATSSGNARFKSAVIMALAALMLCMLPACSSGVDSTDLTGSTEQGHAVTITVDCDENLLFSRYDLALFIDDVAIGSLGHGESDTFLLTLSDGPHVLEARKCDDADVKGSIGFTISGDASLAFRVSCAHSKVRIESLDASGEGDASASGSATQQGEDAVVPDGEISTTATEDQLVEMVDEEAEGTEQGELQEAEEEILTVENCSEFASIMDQSVFVEPEEIRSFMDQYEGRIVEFDGTVIDFWSHGNYTTRFDLLISAGNYADVRADVVYLGPVFSYENVNYYDMTHGSNEGPEAIFEGFDGRFRMRLTGYDIERDIIHADPIATWER